MKTDGTESDNVEEMGDFPWQPPAASESELNDLLCSWKKEIDGDGEISYETSCGEDFILIEGSPEDNLYNFCPSCGKKLDEI